MAKLTSAQLENAKSFINDLFVAGGIVDPNDTRQKNPQNWYGSIVRSGKADAKIVCDEIIGRNFKLFDVDQALNRLSGYGFPPNLAGNWTRLTKKSPEVLADYLANFCASLQLYWDDVNTGKTQYELDNYKNNSIFGSALLKFGCYLSQVNAAAANPQPATKTRAASAPSGPAGSAKADYFKGRNSANARGLVGQAGAKVFFNTSHMYDIEFDKTGSNVIFLYVNTLEKKGDAGGNVNKVLEGSANGWSDAAVYFDNNVDADKFLQAYVSKYSLTVSSTSANGVPMYVGVSSKYTNLRVAATRVDKNGYFKVMTDCGECYIKALKLNEDVEEDETLAEGRKKKISKDEADKVAEVAKEIKSYDVSNINVYEKLEADNGSDVLEEEALAEETNTNTLENRGKIAAEILKTKQYNDFDSFEENLNTYIE